MVYLWPPIYYWIGRRLCGGGVLGYLKRVVFEFNLVFYLCFTLNEVEITVRGLKKQTNKPKKVQASVNCHSYFDFSVIL